jgi:hypothetical protein
MVLMVAMDGSEEIAIDAHRRDTLGAKICGGLRW